jgi:hypothetical protein
MIRHTMTAGNGIDLWGLAFKQEVSIRQLIPLASAGTSIKAAPQGRIAIVFFEQKTENEHKRLYNQLVKRSLYAFTI